MRGETAAKSLNDSLNDAPKALKGSAQVNQALLGTEPHDLSKLIAGLDKVTTALGTNEEQLKELHHQLQPLLRDLRRRADQPAASRSRLLGTDGRERGQVAHEPERGACRSSRASRATSSPASQETQADDHGRDALDRAGRAALRRARSSAACSTRSGRRPRAWPARRPPRVAS